MQLHYFDKGAPVADVKAYIDEWGFAVCRNWLDADVVDDIARDIRRYAERVVGLAWHRERNLTAAAHAFIETATAVGTELTTEAEGR